MKRIIHILLISFATLVLVANNVVLQYVEKTTIVSYDDQDNDEESKSEKNDGEEKINKYTNITNPLVFSYKKTVNKPLFIIINEDQLPSISLDVELLPPNFS